MRSAADARASLRTFLPLSRARERERERAQERERERAWQLGRELDRAGVETVMETEDTGSKAVEPQITAGAGRLNAQGEGEGNAERGETRADPEATDGNHVAAAGDVPDAFRAAVSPVSSVPPVLPVTPVTPVSPVPPDRAAGIAAAPPGTTAAAAGQRPAGAWTRAAALAAQQRPQRFPRALARNFAQQCNNIKNNGLAPGGGGNGGNGGAGGAGDAGDAAAVNPNRPGSDYREAQLLQQEEGLPLHEHYKQRVQLQENPELMYAPVRGASVGEWRSRPPPVSQAVGSGRPWNTGMLARAPTLPPGVGPALFGRRASVSSTADAYRHGGDARRMDSLPARARSAATVTDRGAANRQGGGAPAAAATSALQGRCLTLPDHHRPAGVGFRNPWPSAGREPYLALLRPRGTASTAATGRALLKVARDRKPPDELLATMLLLSARPDFKEATSAVLKDKRAIICHWIGHATMLLHLPGLVVLTDPVWAQRLGPLGPRRLVPPPCEIADLPETIHIVLLSSASYDHFDKHAIEKLVYRVQRWLVPLGLRPLLSALGVDPANVTELDWWQTTHVGDMRIVCTPSQHHSARENALWCSWRLDTPYRRIFFCGGSGYRAVSRSDEARATFNQRAMIPAHVCPAFREIYQRYGSCDIALLPIGSASPRQLMSPINADAIDMLFMHRDLHARHSIVHHWGTFQAGDEGMLDPIRNLEIALSDCPVSEHDITYLKHGHLHNC